MREELEDLKPVVLLLMSKHTRICEKSLKPLTFFLQKEKTSSNIYFQLVLIK